jgi:PAS domain S-box-containing protein
MRKSYSIKNEFWLTLVIGSVLVLLVIILGLSFFTAIFNAQIDSRKDFLNKQTELAARGLELEVRRFEDESKEIITYLEDPGHELDDFDEEFTYSARRLFYAFPNLLDSIWVDMQDSVLVFTMNDRNDFFRTQSEKPFPFSENKEFSNLIIGKKGFRVLYSLDLIEFAKGYVSNYYLNPGGGKFMIFDQELVPLSSTSLELNHEQIEPLIEDVAIGLKGFYEANWKNNGIETSGIIAQYPFSFILSNRSGTLIFAVPTEGLTSGIYKTYFFLFLGFVFLLVATIGFFVVSLKNSLEFQRAQDKNIKEIQDLFDQQGLLLHELRGFFFFHDYKGRMTRVSKEVEETLGHSQQEFMDVFQNEFSHQGAIDVKEKILAALQEGRDLIDLEYDFVKPNGIKIRLKLFEKLLFDNIGRFNGGMGICTDITEQYQSRIHLQESETRLRTLIGNIPDPIFIYNNQGVVIDYHGIEKENIDHIGKDPLGKKLEDFVQPSLTDSIRNTFNDARESKTIQTINVKWATSSREKHFEMRFFPLDSERMMSISKDITGQKIWEKGLMDAMNAADQASKAKSEFLANMSHEIRTPMNGLLGIIDLLEQTNLSKIQKQYVDIVKNSGNTLLGIIKDILDYSKIEAGKIEILKEVFDPIKELESQAQTLLGLASQKQIEFSFKKPSESPFLIEGDKIKLNQIFLNLVGNAIKFTPEKGKVDVELSIDQVSGDSYFLNCSVKDTGIGISNHLIEKLSDPFYQIDSSATRNYQGTGLGLAIAKKLLEMMGGELEIHSEEGVGSVFQFSILVQKVNENDISPVSKEPSWAEIKESGKENPLKILLTEDNDLNLQLMLLMLDQLGFKHEVARNGKDALEKVKASEFDIVLMDVQMPVMNGLEASTEIRKLPDKKDLIIIGLSANVFDDDYMKAIEAGMDDYLTKPIRLAVLADRLNFYSKKIRERA